MPTLLSPGVYVQEVPPGSRPIEGAGTAVAAFIGFTEQGPINQPTLITNWTQFTTAFGGFLPGGYLAHAVYGYFLNGGGTCYVVSLGNTLPGTVPEQAKTLPQAPVAQIGGMRVAVRPEAGQGPEVSVEIGDPVGENPPEGSFRLIVWRGDEQVESFDAVSVKRGRDFVVNAVKESKIITVEDVAKGGLARPENQRVALAAPNLPAPQSAPVSTAVYVGDASQRTGLKGLEVIEAVTMVAVPDLMAALEVGALTLEEVKGVQLEMIAHCEMMGDRVAILDTPPGLPPQQALDWRVNYTGYDSAFAALYYPWIKVLDPATDSTKFVPPVGHLAGIWARNDDERGVHKAPANEVVRGAIDLQVQVTRGEQDLLNPVGVNAIRSFAGRGIRVWGARTLSSDPAWRYLNVRRFFNYLEESILAGTQWVVFEPNDDALWARIRRTISAFLVREWRKSALFGVTPDEAFYVKCDRETNPAEAIDAGVVTCRIGVAPLKPAEFVVFELAQMSGGTSLVSE